MFTCPIPGEPDFRKHKTQKFTCVSILAWIKIIYSLGKNFVFYVNASRIRHPRLIRTHTHWKCVECDSFIHSFIRSFALCLVIFHTCRSDCVFWRQRRLSMGSGEEIGEFGDGARWQLTIALIYLHRFHVFSSHILPLKCMCVSVCFNKINRNNKGFRARAIK